MQIDLNDAKWCTKFVCVFKPIDVLVRYVVHKSGEVDNVVYKYNLDLQ